MAKKLNVTVPDWVHKEIMSSEPKNVSERVTELIIKGLDSQKKPSSNGSGSSINNGGN